MTSELLVTSATLLVTSALLVVTRRMFLTLQDDPKAKMLLLLGEVGGVDEYDLIEAGLGPLQLCLCLSVNCLRNKKKELGPF